MSTQQRQRRGMAALAGSFASRTDSLAARSTEQGITPAPSSALRAVPVHAEAADIQSATGADELDGTAHTGDQRSAGQPIKPATPRQRSSAGSAPTSPVRPMSGPEGRLEASGEQVVKWTLELAPQLIHALAVWERDETKRLGQRVFRERLVDLALDSMPADLDGILTAVAALPAPLRHAPAEQFGTRVRASVRDKLINLKPELRVAGIKDVRIRDIYTAGVYHYLTSLGSTIDPESPKPRIRATETL
jgi:hypothetical protein